MHRRYVAVILLIFSLLAPSATFARRPATKPATQPANSPTAKAQGAQQPANNMEVIGDFCSISENRV